MTEVKFAECAVDLLDKMGDDLTVVNAAKVSFAKRSEWQYRQPATTDGVPVYDLSDGDKRLIQFLATGVTQHGRATLIQRVIYAVDSDYEGDPEHVAASRNAEVSKIVAEIQGIQKHFAPFTHPKASFRIKAPIFVFRQLLRSNVGFDAIETGFDWSEISRRYISGEAEFFKPDTWRGRAENVKQGSDEPLVEATQEWANGLLGDLNRAAQDGYNALLGQGVAPEQARMVLPQNMMTEVIWTGSLYGWARVALLRQDPHAQQETRAVVLQISEHMAKLFPVSWGALVPVT